jgi:uncharacterized protein (TIGR03083 family)
MTAPADEIRLPAREHAVSVFAAETAAFADLARNLAPDDWTRPTDCQGWTVQHIVGHVAAQWQNVVSPRTLFRRRRAGRRRYPNLPTLAAFTQFQVDELGCRPPADLINLLASLGPHAARAAGRIPGPVRRLKLGWVFPEDQLPDPRLGYVIDVIGARDTWMHRVDICEATGRPMELGSHDRHVVEQVIRDLGKTWTAPPVTLELTGPAGGCWSLGTGRPVGVVRADTVAYMRALSGRADKFSPDGEGDAVTAVAAARVVF